MKLKPTLAVLLLTFTSAASAQLELDPKPEDRNAAIRYGMFWSTSARKAPIDELARAGFRDGVVIPQAVDTWLSEDWPQEALNQLCEIAAMPRCDFELPFEEGGAVVPHLWSMYGLSYKVLLMDGVRHLEADERAKAIERFIGAIGVANHAAQDGLGVSANISMRIAGYALDQIEPTVEQGIGSGSAERILAALERFSNPDPFGVIVSIERGPEMCRFSALDLLDATQEVVGGMIEISGLNTGLPRQPVTNDERKLVEQEMVGVERATADMLEAYKANDFQAVREIGRALFKGEYGKLAEIGMSSMTKLRMDQTKLVERMDALKSELREILADG